MKEKKKTVSEAQGEGEAGVPLRSPKSWAHLGAGARPVETGVFERDHCEGEGFSGQQCGAGVGQLGREAGPWGAEERMVLGVRRGGNVKGSRQ